MFFIIIFRIPPRNTWARDILLPMANCAAVQPSLSASRWSSLILTSCLRPSSLFTRSFSHWYPFSGEKMEKSVDTVLISHGRGPTDRGENYTRAGAQREESPRGGPLQSNWPSLPLWSTLARRRCTSLWLIRKQVETRSLRRRLKRWSGERRVRMEPNED